MIRRSFLYIPIVLLAFVAIIYLVLFFTFREESLLGELNGAIQKSGFQVKAAEIYKSFPFKATFEDVEIQSLSAKDRVYFREVSVELIPTRLFSGLPLRVTLTDRQDNRLRAEAGRSLTTIKIYGRDFEFAPDLRVDLPSFFIRKVELDLKDVTFTGGGGISARGTCHFDLDYLTVTGNYGMDMTASGISGKALFRGDDVYFKEGRCNLFSSIFDFEGTVANIFSPGGAQLDIEARSEEPSPMISNFLKRGSESGKTLKIRLRGRINSPQVQVLSE